METIFRGRLRWLDVRIVPLAWLEGHRVDLLIGDRLMRFGYRQIIDDWPAVQDAIARAVAQGLHRR